MTSLSDSKEHNVCKSRAKKLADVNENIKADGCALTFVIGRCISLNQWEGRFVELSIIFIFIFTGLTFQLQRFSRMAIKIVIEST